MVNRVQSLRSSVAGARPTGRTPGELFVNFSDFAFGVVDVANQPIDLVAVRFFSTLAFYAIGDFVIEAGELWRAIVAVTPGAFNPAHWTANLMAGDAISGYLPLTGGTLTGPLALSGAAGEHRVILGQTAGVNRWEMRLGDATVESGANAGSNFALLSYSDAGTVLGTDFAINRATGAVTFGGSVTLAGNAAAALQAVPLQQLTAGLSDHLPLAGGVLTGPLTGTAANFPGGVTGSNFNISDPAGTVRQIVGFTGNATPANSRWALVLGDNIAEAAGNVGSNFGLSRYSNTGVLIDTVLSISRASGQAIFSQGVQALGFETRTGTAGPPAANLFNIGWTSPNATIYIDNTSQGVINQPSDYRIKKDVVDLASTWGRVKTLRPVSYTIKEYTPPLPEGDDEQGVTLPAPTPLFVTDDKERWGFIAHELQEALIEDAATGVKDQANCIQSPNVMTLLAALTAALQEAMARVEALEGGP